ncbi:MAG: preprotein translocase subunit SecG [Bacteroidaceae bacterium]|nr:preprotein translocase subunit SecG [Bacteroidaceae bacterium]
MYNILIILIVIASILMTLIVLIQESKGGGLASGFASSNQIMGVRKTTDVVEKTTWGLAIAMVILSIACAYAIPSAKTVDTSVLLKKDATTTTLPTLPAATQQPAATLPEAATDAQPAPAAEEPAPAAQ